MNNIVHTLIVEATESSMADQAGSTATSVADAASTNRLMVQRDGTFAAGNLTDTSAEQLIKLSAATTMSDGTVSVMSSSEFKLGDIVASHYRAATSPSASNSTVDYANAEQVGGQFFIRFERKSGINVSDTETYSGETLAQLREEFKDAKKNSRSEFENVSLSISDSVLTVTVTPKDTDTDVYISANEGATIAITDTANKRGSLSVAKGLEKTGFISMGAYNQYKFPIVVPESSTAAGEDYGIYTIELKKKVGGRFVYETIKVLVRDDEATPNKTATALNNLLGLSAADVTAPTELTSITFITAIDDNTAVTQADQSDADPFFIRVVGAEVGATLTVTLDSDGAQADVVETFTISTANENFAITLADAGDYEAGDVISLDATLTDAGGNVSAGATTSDTVTIVA